MKTVYHIVVTLHCRPRSLYCRVFSPHFPPPEACHPDIIPSSTDLKGKVQEKQLTCHTRHGNFDKFSYAGFLQSSNCHPQLHEPEAAYFASTPNLFVLGCWSPYHDVKRHIVLNCDSLFVINWNKAIFIFILNLYKQLKYHKRNMKTYTNK
jgi:hypothetical protein